MCKFFSCIATRDGRLLFTEQDRHEEIVRRASLRDEHISYFVRLECLPPFDEVYVDEQEIPTWFDLNEWPDRVIFLASRVNRVFQRYEAVEQPALEQYLAVKRPAWEQYLAVKRSAWEQVLETLAKIEGYCIS